MFDDLFYRLKALVGKKKLEAELDEELRLHLEHEAAKYERKGISADEAWRQANIALGGPEQVREACREARGIRWTEDLLQDCRYALRGVLRRKMFFALILVVRALIKAPRNA
jgi:hypothetical protein